uniref:BAH domain-containing protein n=1 Tax=Opuntia streptacantha TaxID=393608 RepID=A0A7C9EMD9_OPUST
MVETDDISFSWGKKKGRGGAKKEVQFYESFTFDGVEYSLYDSVYLYKEGEQEPYIGKLIKIWEPANQARKVKILWFFHPLEISNHLRHEKVLENELFLASGDGVGLANINPLDKGKYYTSIESRMKIAHDQGTLVLLQNLDPAYTSSEIEDIIWCAFREICSAKMIQRSATSSLHSGQAFVIFKTREAAERIISKLEEECLMLPNLRPLVAIPGALSSPDKQPSFPGHLVIDKLKHQMQRESREAVSTSHSSQSNTLEYELALEWRLLQDRLDWCWRKLHKQQGEELKKLKRSFKSKK